MELTDSTQAVKQRVNESKPGRRKSFRNKWPEFSALINTAVGTKSFDGEQHIDVNGKELGSINML